MDDCRDTLAGARRAEALQMAVLWTFCAPSLCRHVRRDLLRNTWLDCTSIIPATDCHQRIYQTPPDQYCGQFWL